MNIFVLDKNPEKAAYYHCDKHVVKMILESCQILCTVHHLFAVYPTIPYRKTHASHPCIIWVMQSQGNFEWLIQLTKYLLHEYTYRYGKTHKSREVYNWMLEHPLPFNPKILTEFAQVMPDIYKSSDPVLAYREYYKYGKKSILKYSVRGLPDWL